MKSKVFILFFIVISSFCYAQEKKLSTIFSESLDNVNLEARLNRISLSSNHYNSGDRIRVSVAFGIAETGRLKNITVRAPIPQIETTITNELRGIKIPQDILESINLEDSFAFPILFEVKSEREMRKIIAKDKKQKEKEERKKDKKRNNN